MVKKPAPSRLRGRPRKHDVSAEASASSLTAGQRMAQGAALFGVFTMLATCAVAYAIHVRSTLPWMLGPAILAAVFAVLSLVLFYRSYRLAWRSAAVATAARRRSEIRYQDLYENTPVMMHSIDHQGRLVSVNTHWLATLGYRREEVVGRRSIEFLTEESQRHATEHVLPDFFQRGYCHDVSYQMVTSNGQILDVLLSATADRDETGRVTSSRAMIIDVTERRRAAQEREDIIRRLEQKNAELERFSYSVSHDLKSPLVTIKGFLGRLQRDLESGNVERLRADLARVGSAADKMAQLMDRLLELARVGHRAEPQEDVDLGEVAREAVELISGNLTARGVKVELVGELPRFRCERVQMLQVFQNLLENAVKFMGTQSKPQIDIGCREDGQETVCFVRDNGMGVDPQRGRKIFELFQRLDTGEGSGIGLALVQRIIEVHQGRIWVESQGQGQGSTFCFTLPAMNDP